MAREASSLTKAIRSLLEETKGGMTHSQARPRLVSLGFEIAADPKPDMDGVVAEFETKFKEIAAAHDFNPRNRDHIVSLRATTFKKLRWDDKKVKSVTTELESRDAFRNERNSFDVTKYNWRKAQDSAAPTPSRKPAEDSGNTKAKTAAKTGRTASPGTVIQTKPKAKWSGNKTAATVASSSGHAAEIEALSYVEDNGGAAKVLAALESLKTDAATLREQADAKDAEAAALAERLALVRNLKARLEKSAA